MIPTPIPSPRRLFAPRPPAGRQRGIASVLIVLLVGMALSAAVFGGLYELRGLQAQQISMHAQTQAQMRAWTGAEIVRQYLSQLGAADLATVSDKLDATATHTLPLQVTSGTGQVADITVTLSALTVGTDTAQATAVIKATAGSGRALATSTIEVSYSVAINGTGTTGSGGSNSGITAVNIHGDLNMTGGIIVLGSDNANFYVDGNVTLDSASITGINSIIATGNVSIGSGIHVNNVYSNGDVTLTGSASVTQIVNRGNVTLSGGTSSLSVRSNGTVTVVTGSAGVIQSKSSVNITGGGVTITAIQTEGTVNWTGSGGSAGSIQANGNVTYAGSNNNTTISSRGNVTISGGGAQSVHAMGWVALTSYGSVATIQAQGGVTLSGSGGATSVTTQGDTALTGSAGIGGTLLGSGNLLVNGWQAVASGTIGGTLSKTQQYNGSVNVTITPGYKATVADVTAVSVAEVEEFTVPPASVDVYTLKAAANYVFEYVSGTIQVTVAHVSGIPDGSYVLGNTSAGYKDYLCKPENMTGSTCTLPVATICQGFSPQNACFSYNDGAWSVNGTSMARGIAWFDGNLNLGNSTYVDTFLATGNVVTEGSHHTISPNYAGYAAVCTNAVPPGTSLAIDHDFDTLVPTNLCDLTNGRMLENSLGNVGIAAGGYGPDGSYTGGVITLGASTIVDGSVLAGDVLHTGGSTTINGTITSAGMNAAGGGATTISGSTTMDLSSGSSDYDPGNTPCMSASSCGSDGSSGSGNTVTLHGVRYR